MSAGGCPMANCTTLPPHALMGVGVSQPESHARVQAHWSSLSFRVVLVWNVTEDSRALFGVALLSASNAI
eukprot:5367180-Amphidinium_carterae.1